MDKPFAPACERNKAPILDVLRELFADRRHVLEIGSGTGQHAVHFAAALPQLQWQCSELAENLPGLRLWLDEAALPNLPPPRAARRHAAASRRPLGRGVQRQHAAHHGLARGRTACSTAWRCACRCTACSPSTAPSTSAGASRSDSNARFDAAAAQRRCAARHPRPGGCRCAGRARRPEADRSTAPCRPTTAASAGSAMALR